MLTPEDVLRITAARHRRYLAPATWIDITQSGQPSSLEPTSAKDGAISPRCWSAAFYTTQEKNL